MFRLSKKKAFIHSLITCMALVLIANYFIRESLYNLGLDLIKDLQSNHTEISRIFFQLITLIS